MNSNDAKVIRKEISKIERQARPDRSKVRAGTTIKGTDSSGSSLRQEAYEALKEAIQTLKLEPGLTISDSELGRMLGMSRTPVREALASLERDLLVVRIPNHGVQIRKLTIEEIIQIMQMREVLDGMAARLAAGKMDPMVLASLEADFEAMKRKSIVGSSDVHAALSRRLHMAIIEAAGNPFLESASSALMGSFQRIRHRSWQLWNASRNTEKISLRRYAEHMRIIAALKAGDGRAAEKYARIHMVSALRDVLKSVMSTR